MRVLFVGAMSPGRRSMLDGLEALDIEAAFVSRLEDAAPLFDWCDIILFATSERSEMGKVRKLGEGGKPVAVVLRPEDKGLAPLGLEAGAQSVFVDDVHPEEISRFIHAMSEQGMLRREVRWLRTEMRELGGAGTLIGQSAAAERVRRALKKVSRRYRTVLIRGEKGSNFIRHARAAHAHHPGLRHPFLHWEAARQRPAELERALGRLEGGRGEEGDLLRRGGSLFVEDAQNLSEDIQKKLSGVVEAGEASPDFHLVLSHAHDPERLFQDEILPELHEKSGTLLIRIPPSASGEKMCPNSRAPSSMRSPAASAWSAAPSPPGRWSGSRPDPGGETRPNWKSPFGVPTFLRRGVPSPWMNCPGGAEREGGAIWKDFSKSVSPPSSPASTKVGRATSTPTPSAAWRSLFSNSSSGRAAGTSCGPPAFWE